jgi:hypothetical protein
MALALKALYQRIIHGLGLDYDEVLTVEVEETYMSSAPLPLCNVSGCVEETHTRGTLVYAYCKGHFDKYLAGIDVCRVCQHHTCNIDIISSNKLYCEKCKVKIK